MRQFHQVHYRKGGENEAMSEPQVDIRPYSNLSLDEIKDTALAFCMNVYDDYDASEIDKQSASVRACWEIGKAAYDSYQRRQQRTR